MTRICSRSFHPDGTSVGRPYYANGKICDVYERDVDRGTEKNQLEYGNPTPIFDVLCAVVDRN